MDISPLHEELSRQLGFRVPDALVTIVRAAREVSEGTPEAFSGHYYNPGPIRLVGDAARYPTTPPELFPILATGCDGDHWGYVVHAPERGESDFPLASYCPMDADGIAPLGMNTRDTWARFLAGDTTKLPSGFAERICSELKLTLPKSALPEKLTPVCPNGWRYLATHDGVGVLAPHDAFDDLLSTPDLDSPEAVLAAATGALTAGKPATALLWLREAWWKSGGHEEVHQLFLGAWVSTYEALNRGVLAEALRRNPIQ